MTTPPGFDFSQLSYEQKVAALIQLEGAIALDRIDREPALTPEMVAELERRSAAYHSGAMKAHPWEEVQARLMRDR